MSGINTTTTLADIVTANPSLARELERRKLDYCCGGERTLAEACAIAGLDATAVAANLTRASEPPEPAPWTTMDITELVDHIEGTHHRYLWEELPRLDALLEKLHAVHRARHPELARACELFAGLRVELEPHMAKEERVLFPMIRELARADTEPVFQCGSVRNPISVMMREHDAAGAILARLREVTNDYRVPDDGCISYRRCFEGLYELEADTHLHVHKENNLLFPMVIHREEALTS